MLANASGRSRESRRGKEKKLLDLRQRPPKPTGSSKGYVMVCILSCRDGDIIVAS